MNDLLFCIFFRTEMLDVGNIGRVSQRSVSLGRHHELMGASILAALVTMSVNLPTTPEPTTPINTALLAYIMPLSSNHAMLMLLLFYFLFK